MNDPKIRLKVVVCLALLLGALIPVGCSKRGAYESLRYYQQLECDRVMGRDREECLRRAGMSYEEYQRQLDAQEK